MIKVMSIYLLVIYSIVLSENTRKFTLSESAWIVAQGNNQRIYPSVLPLRPNKVAIVQFKSENSLYIAYANLDHRTYRCSAELVEDIKKQFDKNRISINQSDPAMADIININYAPYNDTVWTADGAVTKFFKNYDRIGRVTQNSDTLFHPGEAQVLINSQQYFREKPVYYGIRSVNTKDEGLYSIESRNNDDEQIFLRNDNYIEEKSEISDLGKTDLKSFQQQPGFVSYRKDRTVYEEISVEYSFKTSNIGYWQVHLHPEVWYYPRDPFNGDPIINDDLKMTQKQAFDKREQSLQNPDNLDLKYYRNPYLSDSASVIISFAFADIGPKMKEQDAIDLVDETMHLNHYPQRMYRVLTQVPPTNWIMYGDPLFKLYSKTPEEEVYFSNISSRCPSWEVSDERNAQIIFPEKLQQPGRLVRDKSIDNGIFTYDGCPCSKISTLRNLTAVQLRKLIFLTPPMCDRNEMVKVISIYDAVAPYLKNKNDNGLLFQRKQYVLKVIEERDAQAKKAGVSWVDSEGRCPSTWAETF